MAARQDPEVLVVGAGPVGLFAGLALAEHGVRVQVIDKMSRTGVHSYALALHGRVLRLLKPFGLLDKVLAQAYSLRTIGLFDQQTRQAELALPADEGGIPALVVLPQDAFERVLAEALAARGVEVKWNHAVSQLVSHQDHAAVTIDKLVQESVGYAVAHTEWMVAKSVCAEVPFVIGADGHRSAVRRELDIEFAEAGEAQDYTVFEFETDADLEQQLRLIIGDRTADVLWPLPGGACRWSSQLPDSTAPAAARRRDRLGVMIGSAQYPAMTVEDLKTLIAERAPWFRGSMTRLDWQIVVRFERRLARTFGKQRVWLAGDAGHMTGPVGLQSMNVGLREAADLTEIIAGILRQGQPADRLQTYNQQRLAEWQQLLGLDGGLKSDSGTDPWIRQCSSRLLPCLPATGSELANLLQPLGLRLA
jgi:2-polyprenyl-6-methoxyphenol hydroxylase-like FAD-dependent oxidoreductase